MHYLTIIFLSSKTKFFEIVFEINSKILNQIIIKKDILESGILDEKEEFQLLINHDKSILNSKYLSSQLKSNDKNDNDIDLNNLIVRQDSIKLFSIILNEKNEN